MQVWVHLGVFARGKAIRMEQVRGRSEFSARKLLSVSLELAERERRYGPQSNVQCVRELQLQETGSRSLAL